MNVCDFILSHRPVNKGKKIVASEASILRIVNNHTKSIGYKDVSIQSMVPASTTQRLISESKKFHTVKNRNVLEGSGISKTPLLHLRLFEVRLASVKAHLDKGTSF